MSDVNLLYLLSSSDTQLLRIADPPIMIGGCKSLEASIITGLLFIVLFM
jgi:hypothetical protein